jgi:hypothetical protein
VRNKPLWIVGLFGLIVSSALCGYSYYADGPVATRLISLGYALTTGGIAATNLLFLGKERGWWLRNIQVFLAAMFIPIAAANTMWPSPKPERRILTPVLPERPGASSVK